MFFLSPDSIDLALRLFEAWIINWLRVCYDSSLMASPNNVITFNCLSKPKRGYYEWTNDANASKEIGEIRQLRIIRVENVCDVLSRSPGDLGRCRRTRMHIQFFKDGLQMSLDRIRSDHQPLGDLLVGESLGEQVEHFAFAVG